MEQRHISASTGAEQLDHSGLQVVPVEGGAYPEAAAGPLTWRQEGGGYAYALAPGLKPGEHGAPEVAVASMPEAVTAPPPPPLLSHPPRWKRKRWMLAITLAVFIIIGAVVGGVVGTR